ncbi:MAG: RNA polymerase sigma factor [Mogibacterium sp.]|nr:RNA polymerase sigma factor [Mogibacterium sp.]
MRSDDELYLAFRAGDGTAYDELMLRYGDALLIYLNGYTHNLHDAEDLMIEAFARIMVKKPLIREGNFKAYLFRTGRNLASRFHSVIKRADIFSMETLDHEIADGNLPDEIVWNNEKNAILHVCLERIDPKSKEALWLVYYEGMTYAEAAEVMGVSAKKIDKLLAKGKELMRRELGKEGVTSSY